MRKGGKDALQNVRRFERKERERRIREGLPEEEEEEEVKDGSMEAGTYQQSPVEEFLSSIEEHGGNSDTKVQDKVIVPLEIENFQRDIRENDRLYMRYERVTSKVTVAANGLDIPLTIVSWDRYNSRDIHESELHALSLKTICRMLKSVPVHKKKDLIRALSSGAEKQPKKWDRDKKSWTITSLDNNLDFESVRHHFE